MSIWKYAEVSEEFDSEETIPECCPFCHKNLESTEIRDYWLDTVNEIQEFHTQFAEVATNSNFAEFVGITDEDFEILGPVEVGQIVCYRCPICGWWRLSKYFIFGTKNQVWWSEVGTAGSLKKLDMSDISLPIHEVKSFLCAKYESRFCLSPRKLEEIVSDVFSNFGYKTRVTSYSGDGGIDVVLDGEGSDVVGVQVKRYKDSIKVEQIREFLGALVIGDYTKGAFVTTSTFTKGAKHTAMIAASKGINIELIDGDVFFDALKIERCMENTKYSNFFLPFDEENPPNLFFLREYHLNSL